MTTGRGLTTLPANIDPATARLLQGMRNQIFALEKFQDSQNKTNKSLEQLLKGNATQVLEQQAGTTLPVVPQYRVEPFPTYIAIYLPAIPPYNVELWRAVGAASSYETAQRVLSTRTASFEDHPPAGETYRYWIRYASTDATKFGPFTPPQGILLVTTATADPEADFDTKNGGVFLETFETQAFASDWTFITGTGAVITYPLSGIVGGKVARVAGGEQWRAHRQEIEFDPNQIYRMKIGVRLSDAPSNGATSLRARVRCGFMCLDANKGIVDTTGGNSALLAHWFCAFEKDLGLVPLGTYQEFTGYLSGIGTTPANNASDVSLPSVARSGTKYFRPVVVVNFDDGNGITEIDYIRIEELNPQDVALTGELTNQAMAVPASSAGSVTSYANANGIFRVRYGTQAVNPLQVVYTISANPQALSASINSLGFYQVTGGFDIGEVNATITFRATFQNSQIERTFVLTKAIAGTDGEDGDDGIPGPALFNLVPRGTVTLLTANSARKSANNNTWDSDCYTLQSNTSCFATFRPAQTNKSIMAGLNQDPVTNQTFTSIDYAWYIRSDATLEIYESGSNVGVNFGAYTTSTILQVVYDGKKVRYYKDAVLMRTVVIANLRLAFDSSFYNDGTLSDIGYGPIAEETAQGYYGITFLETWESKAYEKYWVLRTSDNPTISYPASGEYGGTVIRAAGGMVWIAAQDNVAFDALSLYKITARVRRTVASTNGSAGSRIYVGVEGVLADGVTLNNISGVNTYSSQHYNCLSGFDLSGVGINTWYEAVGYFRGTSNTAGGVSTNPALPTKLRTNTKFFRPLLIMNYLDGDGTMECDFIRVERLQPVSTFQIDPDATTAIASQNPADGTLTIPTYSSGGTFRDQFTIASVAWLNDTGETVDLTITYAMLAALAGANPTGAIGQYIFMDYTNGGSPIADGDEYLRIPGSQDWVSRAGTVAISVANGVTVTGRIRIALVGPGGSFNPADVDYKGAAITLFARKR